MENLIVREEGDAFTKSNPPDSYVTIGTHRTGGGGHRWYAYGKIGSSTPEDLVNFFSKNLSLFGGGIPWFEIHGRDIVVYTTTPGGWIGQGGRWVKAMSSCLINRGRVKIEESIRFMTASRSYCPKDFRFLSYVNIEDNEVLKKFHDECKEREMGRKSISEICGSHNYIGDRVVFHPNQKEWFDKWMIILQDKENKILKKREEDAKREEKLKGIHKEYLIVTEEMILKFEDNSDRDWYIDKAKKLKEIFNGRSMITDNGIYISFKGSCEKLTEEEKKEGINKINENILENDYIIEKDRMWDYYYMKKK